jgi:ankyrin repeat protein
LKNTDVNTRDPRGSTPLMYAAAFGSLEAMKSLVAAGADVNAKNAFDMTALLVCSTDLAKVRFLVDKGADVNARSKPGRTPLLIASSYNGGSEIVKLLVSKGANLSVAGGSKETPLTEATTANDTATIKFLIEKGADVNTADQYGQTPLWNASGEANLEAMKLLISKGADVNKANLAAETVKNGPIELFQLTPLHQASGSNSFEAVSLLLDHGAKVDALDARGMTPLLLAVASDRVEPRVVKLLLDKGADPKIKSKAGESTLDWARKFNNPDVLKVLGLTPARAAAPILLKTADSKLTPREAAQKSLALVQKTAASFFMTGGCVSCHAQNLTGMAATIARANGIPVDEAADAEQLKVVKLQWAPADQILIQGMTVPGAMDTVMYSLLQLAVAHAPADRAIDAMVDNLAWLQRQEGNWHFGAESRAPMEDGDFSRTAICLRAFVAYAPAGRKAEFDQRIARAAAWLKSATPRTTEDRNMQLLGLKWANFGRAATDPALQKLIALQHADGGWSQTPDLESDAYATATTLYTLHELGMPATNATYQKGVRFLLRTQLVDGSWHVASRSPKFQPYFQSGFPHDHDQWISAAATSWATMALSYASGDKPLTAALH